MDLLLGFQINEEHGECIGGELEKDIKMITNKTCEGHEPAIEEVSHIGHEPLVKELMQMCDDFNENANDVVETQVVEESKCLLI